jgi:hypothetical protein
MDIISDQSRERIKNLRELAWKNGHGYWFECWWKVEDATVFYKSPLAY